MRENRTYGSEGGGTQTNASFLPLSLTAARNPLSSSHSAQAFAAHKRPILNMSYSPSTASVWFGFRGSVDRPVTGITKRRPLSRLPAT